MRLRETKSIDLGGRSMLINIIAIIINIASVILIAKGFHESTVQNVYLYKTLGLSLLLISLIILFVLKGMYLFSYVARAFVGGLFVVSGLIKANDPWGFSFKLDEYFSPMGLTFDYPFFEHFSPYTLELSIIICIAEIVLGIAVIVGGKIKLTSWLLVIMMLFFTWLTYYTSSCVEKNELLRSLGQTAERDCVLDCGCFGDALRGSVGRSLTPLESFWKDLVLFYFVLVIFINQFKITENSSKENWSLGFSSLLVVIFFSWVFGWYFPIIFFLIALLLSLVFGNMNIGKIAKPWKMAGFVTLFSLLFSLYTSMYLPIKDYRPYKIGNNILDEMNKGEAEVSEFVFIYTNKITGEDKEFDVMDYEEYGDTTKWVYKDRIKTIIKPGVDSPITDFLLNINYEKLTDFEKNHPIIDSILEWDFEMYYENKFVVKSVFGTDTVSEFDYVPYLIDSLYLPDTIFYEKISEFYGLLDPLTPFIVDVTHYVLSLDQVVIMTIRDIKNMNESSMVDFKEIYDGCVANQVPFYILTPANEQEMKDFYEKFNINAPYLTIDGTEIKIIIRSNPGLVLLNNATVIDKWPSRSIPDFDDLLKTYIKLQSN